MSATEMTEIKYGHVMLPFGPNKADIRCGYANFKEGNATIELISVPYGGLYVRCDGEIIERPTPGTVMHKGQCPACWYGITRLKELDVEPFAEVG